VSGYCVAATSFSLEVPMENGAILVAFFLWLGLVVCALVCTVWALLAGARKKAAATAALCLWCTIAGGTLTSAIWSWMTEANMRFQYTKIAHLPPQSTPKDVDLDPIKMLLWFVQLDAFGRRVRYLTVILPLVGTLMILRSAYHSPRSTTMKPDSSDELFHPDR
jgi:hypothetical protein